MDIEIDRLPILPNMTTLADFRRRMTVVGAFCEAFVNGPMAGITPKQPVAREPSVLTLNEVGGPTELLVVIRYDSNVGWTASDIVVPGGHGIDDKRFPVGEVKTYYREIPEGLLDKWTGVFRNGKRERVVVD